MTLSDHLPTFLIDPPSVNTPLSTPRDYIAMNPPLPTDPPKMDAEQPTSEELHVFHENNVRYKTLKEISDSVSELYVSIKDNYWDFQKSRGAYSGILMKPLGSS